MHRFMLFLVPALMMIAGCSKKDEEYNKPALYWYGQMIDAVSNGNLENADDFYSSLQSEHIGSPLLPEATMIMGLSHLQSEEYLLAEHFLDEYVKRYATVQEREFAEYLKVKAKYMALPRPRRDQGLIDDAIAEGERFKARYPRSIFYPVVDTMITRLYLSQTALNETIAELYERLDKPKGAAYYRDIRPQPWIDWSKVEPAQIDWYRLIFEGDGHGSWYGFLIPDTQSVVSRHRDFSAMIPDANQSKEP